MQDKKAARNHFSEKVLSKCNAGLETMALGNNLPQDFGGSDRFSDLR
jgi:hypothetical protein